MAVVGGMDRREARKSVGYSEGTSNTVSKFHGHQLIKDRIAYLRTRVAEEAVSGAAVTKSEIIEGLRDNIALAKQAKPLLGKDGEPTGEYRIDLSSANRGYEILAKMHGFMLDVTRAETFDDEIDGKSPEELKATVLSLIENLDPNLRKMMMAQFSETEEESVPDGETLQ